MTSGTMLGDIRFRIVINGVAANGSDVAALLCKLEDSSYFRHVNLLYVKESEVKPARNTKRNIQQDTIDELADNQDIGTIKVSEFKINCYLSNYIEPN